MVGLRERERGGRRQWKGPGFCGWWVVAFPLPNRNSHLMSAYYVPGPGPGP